MQSLKEARSQREIDHGRKLAANDPEAVWGWNTPAGRVRARRRAALIIEGGGLRRGRRVLELGCGTGYFTQMFAATGAQVTAIDISSDLLALAEIRDFGGDRPEFMLGRFEECELRGPFDAVIGSSVLHHLDVAVALQKIHRLLRPGGQIAFAEPNLLNPQVYLERRFAHWKCFSYTSPDEVAFIRWWLDKELAGLGFGERHIMPFDWLHPATPAWAVEAVSWASQKLERIPVVREFSGSLLVRARSSP